MDLTALLESTARKFPGKEALIYGDTAVTRPGAGGRGRLPVHRRPAQGKIPRELVLRDSLPRNASGKLTKHVLRAELSPAGAATSG